MGMAAGALDKAAGKKKARRETAGKIIEFSINSKRR